VLAIEMRRVLAGFVAASEDPRSELFDADSDELSIATSNYVMRFVRLIVAVVLCAAASCSSDAAVTPSTVSFAGTYTLKTVNGQNLPFVTTHIEGFSQAIASSTITVADGGSWSETRVVQTTEDSQTSQRTVVDSGTWIHSGNLLNLQSAVTNATAFTGTFTGSQLNFTDFTYPFVFVR
jgi:hypothetical protein